MANLSPMAVTKEKVAEVYVILANRAIEKSGLDYWFNQYQSQDVENLASGILENQAAKDYFGANLTDNEKFIKMIYKNALGKEVEPDALAWWLGKMNDGQTKAEVIKEMVWLMNNPDTQASDPTATKVYQNKVAVSLYMASKFDNVPKFDPLKDMSNPDDVSNYDFSKFKKILADTNSTNLEAQKEEVNKYVEEMNKPTEKDQNAPENTVVLTTDRPKDVTKEINGTDKNDLFKAMVYKGNGDKDSALIDLDTLDGKGGNDTLELTITKNSLGKTAVETGDYINKTLEVEDLPVSNVTNVEKLTVVTDLNIGDVAGAAFVFSKFDTLEFKTSKDANIETESKELTAKIMQKAKIVANKATKIDIDLTNIDHKFEAGTSFDEATDVTFKNLTIDSNGTDIPKAVKLTLDNVKIAEDLTVNELTTLIANDVQTESGKKITTTAVDGFDLTFGGKKSTVELDDATLKALTIHANADEATLTKMATAPAALTNVVLDGKGKAFTTDLSNATALESFDGTKFTGNTTLTTADTPNLSVKLGSGEDTVIFENASITNNDMTFDGGEGLDIIAVKNALAKAGAAGVKFTNFEALKITEILDGEVDMATKWSEFNKVILAKGAAAGNVKDLVDNGTVEIQEALTGALTISIKDAATSETNTLNLEISPLSNVAGLDNSAQNITVAQVETINLKSQADTAETKSKTLDNKVKLAATDLANLKITGDAAKTTVTFDNGTKKIKSVDATELKGNLVFDDNIANVHTIKGATIKAGAGDDVISFGPAAIVTGGEGKDDFVVKAQGASITQGISTKDIATIVDFTKDDKITLKNAVKDKAIVKFDSTQNLDFADNLSKAIDLIKDDPKAGESKTVYFTYTDKDTNKTDTYLVTDNDGAIDVSNTYIVKLGGVVDLDTLAISDTDTITIVEA